jgi:hypothetical protein
MANLGCLPRTADSLALMVVAEVCPTMVTTDAARAALLFDLSFSISLDET